MARYGWVKLWRTLLDNPIWLEKPFSKGQAWVDLLLLAQQQDNEGLDRFGNHIKYERGKIYESVSFLSERWGWSRARVRRFLENLEKSNMIRLKARPGYGTALTIENWGKFQDRRPGDVTGAVAGGVTAIEQVALHNIRSKEDKEEKNVRAPDPDGWSPPKKGTPEYERWRNQ